MYDIEKNLGLQRATRSNLAISYESLTGRFDGLPPTQKTLDLVVYYFEELSGEIRQRPKDESGRHALLPEEIRKLAFLRRTTLAFKSRGIRSNKLIPLEAMKWLAKES